MAIESPLSSSSSSGSSSSSKAWIFGAIAAVAIGAQLYLCRSRKFRTRVVGIIPARFASSRFPGKPLVQILGKPMIQRTWEQTKLASTLDHVVVATDDDKIAECCRGFGADVVMTSESSEMALNVVMKPSRSFRRSMMLLSIFKGMNP